MNKTELVDAVSANAGLTKIDAEKAISSILKVIEEALKEDKKVTLVGFGSFSVKTTAGRSGRDFTTGNTIDIPAGKTVKFKVGKNLKDSVNSCK